ncbi:MAG: D-tyrosyl-tRNA(Tyr) deacylase [Acidobacteria bacterium]|nr:D-tyrosyl-tRNA(Tyr) deacylase [Acidobacteriota bacterium]MCA1610464.1 D-tyrosyl-tRNA(Tyr) deacylase [Acidobacteriota bacterium]
MRLVLQRVSEARVDVDGRTAGQIGRGLVVLLGAEEGDTAAEAEEAARRVAGLRIFEDAAGKMNLSITEVGGAILAISQFTLVADLSRGRRPGFDKALRPEAARPLYEHFCAAAGIAGIPVERGVFGAWMKVSLVNEGPATFVVEVGEKLKVKS